MLLLMGIFSIYCGVLYNDVFGLMADFFGTSWTETPPRHGGPRELKAHGMVYPFGIDPGWHRSANELSFGNSYKMKLSIILGVLQVRLVPASLCSGRAPLCLPLYLPLRSCS